LIKKGNEDDKATTVGSAPKVVAAKKLVTNPSIVNEKKETICSLSNLDETILHNFEVGPRSKNCEPVVPLLSS